MFLGQSKTIINIHKNMTPHITAANCQDNPSPIGCYMSSNLNQIPYHGSDTSSFDKVFCFRSSLAF